jgi:hypothetical protein
METGVVSLSADLARGIPGAQLVVLKQAAHTLLTESPEATDLRELCGDLAIGHKARGRRADAQPRGDSRPVEADLNELQRSQSQMPKQNLSRLLRSVRSCGMNSPVSGSANEFPGRRIYVMEC